MGEVKRDADFEVYVVVALAAVRVQSLEPTLREGQHRMRAVKERSHDTGYVFFLKIIYNLLIHNG